MFIEFIGIKNDNNTIHCTLRPGTAAEEETALCPDGRFSPARGYRGAQVIFKNKISGRSRKRLYVLLCRTAAQSAAFGKAAFAHLPH